MEKRLEQNLTEGGVVKQLLRFCLPFLLSNFLQAMYGVTDTLIVSWFAGSYTVSGVAIGGQINMVSMNFAIGFTVGGTVLIGQYFGANKREDMTRAIGTMFTALTGLSVLITVIVIIFAKPILTLIGTPTEAFSEAYIYLVICMCGTVFTFGYNAVSAILRGMGDSKSPLYFVLIAGVVNTLLDIPFVGVFHWDAAGDAASTIIAQALSLILAIVYLRKKKFVFDFKLSNFRIDMGQMKRIFRIGLPNSIQNVVVGLSFLVMTVLVNRFGVDASAAVGIADKLNGFAILPAIAMSASVSSMAAQNIGAGKIDRAKKVMHAGVLLALPMGTVFFCLAFFAPEWMMRIFTNEPAVLEMGVQYLRLFSFDYIVVSVFFSLNGLLMGAGMTAFTMINGVLASVVLRVPAAYALSVLFGLGLGGVGLGVPIASLGALIIAFFFYKSGVWKRKNLVGQPIIMEDAL